MRFKRKKLSKRVNRKNFKRTATRVHKKNLTALVRRGGTRL